jgi:hypothetical protein
MDSQRSFGSLMMKRRLVERMQLPPEFELGCAIFFEHVHVCAEHHGNCFGLQLMRDLIKYAHTDAFIYGGSAVAFLWSSPHQFNGHDGLRRPDVFGMHRRRSTQ